MSRVARASTVLLLAAALVSTVAAGVPSAVSSAVSSVKKSNVKLADLRPHITSGMPHAALSGRKFQAQQTESQIQCLAIQVTALSAMQGACGSDFTFDDIGAAIDISNNSATALRMTDRVCAAGCVGTLRAQFARFNQGNCFDTPQEYDRLLAMLSLCNAHEGVSCARRLRTLGSTADCDDWDNNETACNAAINDGKWCKWHLSGNKYECDDDYTPARLQQYCTPCLDRYILLLPQLVGNINDAAEVAKMAAAQTAYSNLNNLICSKVENTWCWPTLEALGDDFFEPKRANETNMTMADIEGNTTAWCGSTGKQCGAKVAVGLSKLTRDLAQSSLRTCRSRSCTNSRFSNGLTRCSELYRGCAEQYYNAVRGAASIQATVGSICKSNAAGQRCWPKRHQLARDECNDQLRGNTCNATCAQWLSSKVQDFGCCLNAIHRAEVARPDATLMPPEVSGYVDTRPIEANWTNAPTRSYATVCNASVSGWEANYTEIQNITLSGCVVIRSAPKNLKLRGLRWSKMQNNATLKARMESSLQRDVARTAAVAVENVNGSLQEDSTQSLTDSTARRSTTATSGTEYVYTITGDSASEVAAATRNLNTAEASGELQVTETAAIITEECTTCMGAPTAAPGQTPAPPPTGNLFASLTGGDTSGEHAPSPAPFASVVAAVVMALAVVLTVA